MTEDVEIKLVLAAMAGRTDKAMAALSQAEGKENASQVIAGYIWDIMAILDLLTPDTASLTSHKLDLLVKEAKKLKPEVEA